MCDTHRPPTGFRGTHHSKGIIFFHPRGIRVCIHTANYIHTDIFKKTQGIWIQDFPLKPVTAPEREASRSDFETVLTDYFTRCCKDHERACGTPRLLFGKYDFRAARGSLVCSVPGFVRFVGLHLFTRLGFLSRILPPSHGSIMPPLVTSRLHQGQARSKYGHRRVKWLLGKELWMERNAVGKSGGSSAGQNKSSTRSVFAQVRAVDENWPEVGCDLSQPHTKQYKVMQNTV